MKPTRILIVDDEVPIVEPLKYHLEREGYEVSVAHDGREALVKCQTFAPDLVILDVMLPIMDGLSVCRQIRSSPSLQHIRILMLTAKGEETDEIVGFSLGADDYVAKPFRTRPLVERVKALLRRPTADDEAADILDVEDIHIDRIRHEVLVAGQELILTPTEFRLLWTLGRQRGRTFSRHELLDCCRGEDANSMERTIDVHIRALRKKLDKRMDLVETVRGIGYRFRPER